MLNAEIWAKNIHPEIFKIMMLCLRNYVTTICKIYNELKFGKISAFSILEFCVKLHIFINRLKSK